MKKLTLAALIIGLALVIITCNTDDGPGGGGQTGGGGDNPTWTDEHIYNEFTGDGAFKGATIDLKDLNLTEISDYQSVIVTATLYTDAEGKNKAALPADNNETDADKKVDKNLAQFSLLKDQGDWENNKIGVEGNKTKYNMVVEGPTSWNNLPDGTDIPKFLLIEVNHGTRVPEANRVKSIKVTKIEFIRKTGAPVLDNVYGESYVVVNGNKIEFKNATYSDGAAIFNFPASFPQGDALKGKNLVIKFSISTHNDVPSTSGVTTGIEHQIHIQAANSDKQHYNGLNPDNSNGNKGQIYITLNDADKTGWADNSGTITVPLNTLLDAATVTGDDSSKGIKGPFTLNAIRIANNGTTWKENEGQQNEQPHVRCKSYELVIDSIEVK